MWPWGLVDVVLRCGGAGGYWVADTEAHKGQCSGVDWYKSGSCSLWLVAQPAESPRSIARTKTLATVASVGGCHMPECTRPRAISNAVSDSYLEVPLLWGMIFTLPATKAARRPLPAGVEEDGLCRLAADRGSRGAGEGGIRQGGVRPLCALADALGLLVGPRRDASHSASKLLQLEDADDVEESEGRLQCKEAP